MQLNPRHKPVRKASLELSEALGEIITRHNLTFAEIFSILSELLAEWASMAMRSEREKE